MLNFNCILFLAMILSSVLSFQRIVINNRQLTSRPAIFNLKNMFHSTPIAEAPMKPFQPILVSLEGNIGSGKSTLLKKLKKNNPKWTYIDEPVDLWSTTKNENGESLLEAFYKDRKRWSYTFQNCVLFTRHQYIESTIAKVRNRLPYGTGGKHIFLTERCLDTDYEVFARMLMDDGFMDKMESELYLKLYNQLQTTATPLSAIVHVNTPPNVCISRIKQRSRTGESNISLEYLTKLNTYQSRWIAASGVPTLVTQFKGDDEIQKFIESLGDVPEDDVISSSGGGSSSGGNASGGTVPLNS